MLRVLLALALIPAALLLAAGRSRAVALASIGGFVVGIVTVVATGPSLGVWAGSVGFLVGSTVNLVAVVVIGLGRVDQPIAALVKDLKQRGLLDDTLIVGCSEFGRSPWQDLTPRGRAHHNACFTCFLAGGGVRGN